MDSFSQISKSISLPHLNELLIQHNKIENITLFRDFIIYRLENIIAINGKVVTEMERRRARIHFLEFENLQHSPLLVRVMISKKYRNHNKILIRMISKK